MRERLLKDLHVESRHLDVDGAPTYLLESGDGPPLVLIHGAVPVGGVIWLRIISALATNHRVIVPDVPGFGQSPPVSKLDVDVAAGWLAALIRATCSTPPTVVAHSMLGSLAAGFASRQSTRLRHLVISGAPAIGSYRMPLGLRAAAVRLTLAPSARSLEHFLRWPFLDWERTRSQDPEWFDAFTAYLLSRGSLPHVKKAMRQTVSVGARRIPNSLLDQIDAPTSLLWGRYDRMAPLSVAGEAASNLGWPLHVIDGCGHVPYLEKPDAAATALEQLMRAQSVHEGDSDAKH